MKRYCKFEANEWGSIFEFVFFTKKEQMVFQNDQKAFLFPRLRF